jgi:signal transduction histidine kinase
VAGERVLLVDDDAIVSEALGQSLRRAGYVVDIAGDVSEALTMFDNNVIDVVVTDLLMPGESGLDLLRHIYEADPELPVIIITADQSVQAAAEAVRGDAFDYLTKPMSRDELLEAVQRAASRRRDARHAQAEQQRRDVEHRRLEARHNFIAQLLGVLYDRAQDGIVVFDEMGRVLDASRSFSALVGRDPARLFRADSGELFEPHPTEGDISGRISVLASSLSPDTQWRGDVSVRVADGRSVPARLSLSVCVAPSEVGTLQRYVVGLLFHETTHEELSEHLQRADRLATVGLLAGSAAHEIKNELGPLIGFLSMLAEGGAETLQPRMISAMRDSVRRVHEHVEQILEPLRPRVRSRGAVLLRPCVDSILEVLTRAGRMRRIHLEVHAPEEDVVVLADRDEVHQVALNLISNAVDALGDGDGGARGRVEITLSNEDDYGVLEVADDGVGVDPAARARVFEPFFTTKGPAGTGLGLPVVHDIVRTLRGRVSLEPRRERGTVVRVALPRYRA